ncbi:MAG: hypothetical protein FJ206_11220 [Gemmatimonadetes bacterium]|nr:hypothetical protein [Gemmatimonadota bacterium]
MIRSWLPASALMGLALTAGCLDEIVRVEERDVIPPDQINTAAGAAALYAGALRDFGIAIDGDNGGTEGQILISGMMSDEFYHSGTFSTRVDYDMRAAALDNGTLAGVFRVLQNARLEAGRAVAALQNSGATDAADPRLGVMYNRIGAVYLYAAMNYCNGVPFSELVNGAVEPGTPQTTAQIIALATAQFDKALAGAAGTNNVNHNTARLLKARALMLQGPTQFAAAVSIAAAVPTNFRAVSEHSIAAGPNENGVFVFNHLSKRWSMAHQDGGNGLPFRGAGNGTVAANADPRLPWTFTGVGFDNTSPQCNWLGSGARDAAQAFAKGEEARLNEAEAALQTGDATTWLAKHNTLRATVAGLAPLTDPGDAASRLTLHFAERAFWLYGTGVRLSDLRRLVRQYGRAATAVFPNGAYRKGGNYGTDTNFPVPTQENQNPNFRACIDRNP